MPILKLGVETSDYQWKKSHQKKNEAEDNSSKQSVYVDRLYVYIQFS